ncbi:hypothetical protein SD80_012810 [Scytonema tolypothrichoides VB-61278]|nr:hypothetical protein SD80_012810 [Scytonema tolypothrichoides VB-61278]
MLQGDLNAMRGRVHLAQIPELFPELAAQGSPVPRRSLGHAYSVPVLRVCRPNALVADPRRESHHRIRSGGEIPTRLGRCSQQQNAVV